MEKKYGLLIRVLVTSQLTGIRIVKSITMDFRSNRASLVEQQLLVKTFQGDP